VKGERDKNKEAQKRPAYSKSDEDSFEKIKAQQPPWMTRTHGAASMTSGRRGKRESEGQRAQGRSCRTIADGRRWAMSGAEAAIGAGSDADLHVRIASSE
jgi:hypothetical protein